jgi:hypothetical protein
MFPHLNYDLRRSSSDEICHLGVFRNRIVGREHRLLLVLSPDIPPSAPELLRRRRRLRRDGVPACSHFQLVALL